MSHTEALGQECVQGTGRLARHGGWGRRGLRAGNLWTRDPGGHREGFRLRLGSNREPPVASEQGGTLSGCHRLGQGWRGGGVPSGGDRTCDGVTSCEAEPSAGSPPPPLLPAGRRAPALTSVPSFLQAPVGTPKGRLRGGAGPERPLVAGGGWWAWGGCLESDGWWLVLPTEAVIVASVEPRLWPRPLAPVPAGGRASVFTSVQWDLWGQEISVSARPGDGALF